MSRPSSDRAVATPTQETPGNGTSEMKDSDVIVVEEFDNVRADLRRKQRAASARRRHQQQQDTSTSVLFGTDVPMPLSSDDKTTLAIGVSANALLPGAYTGYGNDNGGPKPSQDQLMEIARQKDREKWSIAGPGAM